MAPRPVELEAPMMMADDDDGRWLFPSPHLRNGWGQPSPSGPAPLPTLITSGHIPGCVSS